MSGAHTLRHKPFRITLPRVSWHAVGLVLLDVADVLWKCAIAAIASALLASVVVLIAKDFYEHAEPSAAVMTIVFGFAAIVALLITWAGRAT